MDVSYIKVERLKSIIGKNNNSEDVGDFFGLLGSVQEISGPYSDGTVYHSWKQCGVSVRFESDVVGGIFLYAENADNFSQYRGEIPEGISFLESRKSIEERLGVPEASGGSGVISFWVLYDNLGLGITYKALDPQDMSTTIHCIQVRPRKTLLIGNDAQHSPG